GCHDVRIRCVEALESRVKGGCFSRAGGTRHQDHSERLGYVPLKPFEALDLKAQLSQVKAEILFVQEAEHYLLAEDRRKARNAKIQLSRLVVELDPEFNASILGQALFGDIKPGKYFQPGRDGVPHLHRRIHYVVQDAVYPEPDSKLLLEWFHVDIRGSP